jgi:hypothetical protein
VPAQQGGQQRPRCAASLKLAQLHWPKRSNGKPLALPTASRQSIVESHNAGSTKPSNTGSAQTRVAATAPARQRQRLRLGAAGRAGARGREAHAATAPASRAKQRSHQRRAASRRAAAARRRRSSTAMRGRCRW